MPITPQVMYVCDYDDGHTSVTAGEMPIDWLQVMPAWDTTAWRYFDTMSCVDSWVGNHPRPSA